IVDAVDVPGFGLVRTKANNIYVTPNSFYAPDGTTTPSIQRAIDVASSGETVNIEAGTYPSSVNVNKSLTIAPAGSSSSTGIVNITGTLNFSVPGSTLQVDVNGTTPGTDYDQINATGAITLGGNVTLAVNTTGLLPILSTI